MLLKSMMEHYTEKVVPILKAAPSDAAMHDRQYVEPIETEFQRRRSLWWTCLEKLDVQQVSAPQQAEYLLAMDHAHGLLVNHYNTTLATALQQAGHASADKPRSLALSDCERAIQNINSKWSLVMTFAQSLRKLWEN